MSTINLRVTGMTCGHCEQAVRKALEGVAGVERVVTVDRERELAVVEGQPQADALVKVVEEEGYGAEVA